MKNLGKKAIALVLAAMLSLSMVACGGETQQTSAGTSTTGTTSAKQTSLKIYLFGQAEDFDKVLEAFETQTKDTLNTKLDIVWSDAQTHREKVPLMMANQEEADIVFDAYWMNLSTMQNQGAYATLNEYFHNPEYPGLQAAFEAGFLEQVTDEDGNIFAIPFTQAAEDIPVIAYRKDLADKYGITIDSDEALEAYFKAVQEDIASGNLTMVAPFGIGGTRGFYWLNDDRYEKRAANVVDIDGSAYGIGMEFEVYLGKDGTAVEGIGTLGDADEVYANFPAPYNTNTHSERVINKLTKWSQYIQADAQTEDDPKTNLFYAGKVAAIEGNIANYTDYETAVKALGGELGVYVYNENMRNEGQFVTNARTAWNFLCIPQQSKKKDEAMKFIDWLFQSQENHDLFELGIEGVDWKAEGADEYTKVEGSNYSFPGYEMTWNPNFIRTNAGLPEEAKKIVKYGNDPDTYITSPIAGFAFDTQASPELQTAFAAVSAIQTEYQKQIMLGLKKDPAAAKALLEEYHAKAMSAGLDVIREAVKTQVQDYLDSKN